MTRSSSSRLSLYVPSSSWAMTLRAASARVMNWVFRTSLDASVEASHVSTAVVSGAVPLSDQHPDRTPDGERKSLDLVNLILIHTSDVLLKVGI